MKCKSCNSEINPKWKHAIDNNICPFCGESIMDEELKKMFSSLRIIMNDLINYNYVDQLEDWLISNYQFVKIDSPRFTDCISDDILNQLLVSRKVSRQTSKIDNIIDDSKKYTVKIKTEHGEEEVMAEKTQSEDQTNGFFKRAEAIKPNIDGCQSASEKTQRLKSLAQQIKKAGSPSLTQNDISGTIPPEMIEQADPEAVAEMESLLSTGPDVASALSTEGDDEIPSVVLAMANKAQGKNSSVNSKDLIKLQQMQDRIKKSKENFESGDNHNKGGFSRSS